MAEPLDVTVRGLTMRITQLGSYKYAVVLNQFGKCVTRGATRTTILHPEPLLHEFRNSVTHEMAVTINTQKGTQAYHDACLYFVEMIRRHGIKR